MVKLPDAEQVGVALSALLRRDVRARALKVQPKGFSVGGLYHGGDGKVTCSVVADVSFAAYSAASFSLIPADVAEECIGAGVLDDNLRENFAEVLNVLSRLFTPSAGTRVTLKSPLFPPAALPGETTAPPAAPAQGACFEVDIDGYGAGTLCLRVFG